jgi:hypothetical protein
MHVAYLRKWCTIKTVLWGFCFPGIVTVTTDVKLSNWMGRSRSREADSRVAGQWIIFMYGTRSFIRVASRVCFCAPSWQFSLFHTFQSSSCRMFQ